MNEPHSHNIQIDMNIRLFQIPVINIKAKSFHQIVNLNLHDIQQPPAIKCLTDLELDNLRNSSEIRPPLPQSGSGKTCESCN